MCVCVCAGGWRIDRDKRQDWHTYRTNAKITCIHVYLVVSTCTYQMYACIKCMRMFKRKQELDNTSHAVERRGGGQAQVGWTGYL